MTIDAGTGVATGVSDGASTITYTVSASPCTDATATIVLTVSNDYLTTGVNSNWSNTACWGGGVVPPSSGDVTVSHDITVDASTNTLGAVTVDASKTLTIATGQTITAGGASDINGTLSIEGSGTYDANGNFDATTGTIDFTGSGTLKIGATLTSTTTSLGTLDAAAGTVWYDGGPLTIVSDDYYSLKISQSNTKTATGTVNVNGDLTLNSGATYSIGATTTTVTGTSDLDGTLAISTGVYDANGAFDATDGTIDFSGAGTLLLGSTVSSLGTLDAAAGTVWYDGGPLTIVSDDYYSLKISQSNTKTAAGTVNVNGDLTLNSGATYSIGATTTTVTGTSDLDGTLAVSTGVYDANGTFDATGGNVTFSGAGRLQLGGTVTSLGTFTPGTSVVEYDGGAQTIDDFSAKSGPYYDLEIDGSGDKTLSGNTTVSNQLTFSADHDLVTSGSTLTITRTPIGYSNNRLIKNGNDANAVTVAYSSTSTTKCEIPVGIDGSHRMISLSAGGTSATTYTVAYTPGSPGTINWNTTPTGVSINPAAAAAHVNNHYYYDISRSGSEDVDCEMQFVGLTEPSDADKYIMHWNTGTSRWDQLTSSGSSGVVAATLTSFSPFTQGSGGGALPIDLVSFEGKCENNETELEFVVASQENNDYFSIHRSENATDWNLVGEIEGVGNTSTQMTYKWIDNNPISGTNYYRLSQTDYDGTSESFAPIVVTCETAPIDGYSVYPNPADGLLNIDLELEHNQGDDVSIEVIDINGKVIQLQQVQLTRGYNHLEVDLSEIPSGVYMINFAGTKDYIKESRIVKQ